MRYIGRFAPSPSGDLHFGSLVTAIGSYLQAKSQQGVWRVRIEDIDPPREVHGASQRILSTLERFGLHWDGAVLYQSTCTERYLDILSTLIKQNQAYYCHCTRQRLQSIGGIYDGACKRRHLSPATTQARLAIRLAQTSPVYQFVDGVRGSQQIPATFAREDFILRRRDGLFAYNLAVVIDDHFQGVTEIVRGADLLLPTSKQLSLYRQFNWPEPQYLHLPLALNQAQQKLSKQNHAPSIHCASVKDTLIAALTFLGQPVPADWQDYDNDGLLDFAIKHWDVNAIPNQDRAMTHSERV